MLWLLPHTSRPRPPFMSPLFDTPCLRCARGPFYNPQGKQCHSFIPILGVPRLTRRVIQIPYRSGVATSPRTPNTPIFDREALRASAHSLCCYGKSPPLFY